MSSFGFALEREKVIYEKKHYYVIMYYIKGNKKVLPEEIAFGLYAKENEEYYQFLDKKLKQVKQKIPWKCIKQRNDIVKQIKLLKKYLKERKPVDL